MGWYTYLDQTFGPEFGLFPETGLSLVGTPVKAPWMRFNYVGVSSGSQYFNGKYNPPKGFYGYLSLMKDEISVIETHSIDFQFQTIYAPKMFELVTFLDVYGAAIAVQDTVLALSNILDPVVKIGTIIREDRPFRVFPECPVAHIKFKPFSDDDVYNILIELYCFDETTEEPTAPICS